MLAGNAQGCAAGRDHLQSGARAKKLSDDRRRGQDLLEVVEHEEDALVLDVIEDAPEWHLRAGHLDTKTVRDGGGHELRIADRSQWDKVRAVAETLR